MRPMQQEHHPGDLTSSKPQSLGSIRLLWGFMLQQKGRFIGGMLLVLVSGGLTTSMPLVLRHWVDLALAGEDPAAFTSGLLALLGVTLGLALSSMGSIVLLRQAGDKVVSYMRAQLFAHLTRLPMNFYEQRRTGALMSRLIADSEAIKRSVGMELPNSLTAFVVVLVASGFLFYINLTLTLALGGVALLTVPLMAKLGGRMRPISRSLQDSVADISTHAEEIITHMKTVQAYNQQPQVNHLFDGLLAENLRRSKKMIFAIAHLVTVNAVIQNLAYLVVIGFGGHQVMQGQMSVGDLAAYMVYVFLIGNTFIKVAHFWPYLQTAAGATERMFDLLQTDNTIIDPVHPVTLPPRQGGREVAFIEVAFSYPTRPHMAAAEEITLVIPANSRVAIVGPSGAGKSTLFQLLLHFYAPQRGHIDIDGVNINQMTLHHLRDQIALVSQDPVVFASSVVDNIRFGRPGASDAAVEAAAKAAFADGFIRSLPQGYQTLVGERGVKISGGERQRIAIARALLCDPAILLLDEATSNLDAEAEALVQKALDKLMQGRTTLVIAHRLSTVVNADKIVVIDRGRVVAEGTHAQLLKTSSLYKKLATLQLQTSDLSIA